MWVITVCDEMEGNSMFCSALDNSTESGDSRVYRPGVGHTTPVVVEERFMQ